jgi:hypothetical protein
VVGDKKGDPHGHGPARGQLLWRRPRPCRAARRARYDPEDLSRIDVYLNGTKAGVATPFVTRRHTHRAVPQAARAKPVPTGIDYLDMVATAHEESAGTGQKIDFAQLAMFQDEHEEQSS